jgi:hypothetical protein
LIASIGWQVERIMFVLPRLDQSDEHVESITFGGVMLRHHQTLDFFEEAAVIALGLDRCDVYRPYPRTVFASIASYEIRR